MPEQPTADARPLRLALFVLTVAWLALFAPQLFGRQVFVLGDARSFRPFSEYSRERWLAEHERTYWNPFVLTGVASSASLADMRPQYLPDAALDVFERVRLGRWVPLAAPLLAHLAGMLAMAALAWWLWAPSALPLVWAGLAWGLSPLLLVPIAFGHTAYFVAVSLLPPMLLAVLAHSRATSRAGALGAGQALAGLAGLQALTGHPQIVAYSGALVLGMAIVLAFRTRRPTVAIAAALALAWGAAIATAVWLPALDYGAHSNRGAGVAADYVRTMSIAWRELFAFAFPRAIGGAGPTYWGGIGATDYPRFFGTTVMALAVASLVLRPRGSRAARFALAAVVIAAIALAVGPRLGPLYTALVTVVPVFARFRVASMALVLGVPALALLSAAALADVTAPSEPESAHRSRAPWIALGALLVAGLLLMAPGASLYVTLARALRADFPTELAQQAARAAGLDVVLRALLLGALLLLLQRWRAIRWAPVLAVGLLVLDLGPVSAPDLIRGSAPEAVLTAQPEPALARFGRENPTARVLSTRVEDVSAWQIRGLERQPEMRTNAWIRWGAHAYGGEHGTPPATWEEFTFLRGTEPLRALGVGYVSSPPDSPQDSTAFTEVARTPDELVYRLRGALGRAYTVGSVRALPSAVDVARAMVSDSFVADRIAYTQDRASEGDYPGSATARITWQHDEPEHLALRIDCDAPAFVVVADSWFPGWTAELDGKSAPIARVNYSLRGVAVPAGSHELRMQYEPEGWATGTRVTHAALGLWLLAGLAWLAFGLRRRLRPA